MFIALIFVPRKWLNPNSSMKKCRKIKVVIADNNPVK